MLENFGGEVFVLIETMNNLNQNLDNFNIILNRIEASILIVNPTNLVPEPTEPNRQLELTIYKLARGCTFTVKDNVFGILESLATQTFNHVNRELVVNLLNEYTKMPPTEQELINETKDFIENYEFPSIGAWDTFPIYIYSKLKKTTTIINIDIQFQTWDWLRILGVF